LTHYTKGTLSHLKGAPTVCRRPVSGSVSLPSSGCFSPFPHGTGSLSVSKEYLAFEGGPPIFRQDFTCPALLNTSNHASYTGLSPISLAFPDHSSHIHCSAGPRSLAATRGVSIDVLSSGYLDVSVPRVCSFNPMYSDQKYLSYPISDNPKANNNRVSGGLPHSDIHGSKLILSSPWLNAEYHVLHRLLLPRHPPNALIALDPIQKTMN
jgi:hypothetical protein